MEARASACGPRPSTWQGDDVEDTVTEQRRPGALMAGEVAAQPGVLAGLVAQRDAIAAVAEQVAAARPRFVLLAARGSSDHAALYAKYLIEVLLQLPAGLVSPSTTTLYGAEPDLTDVLAIGSAAPDVPATTRIAIPETAEEVAPILEILPVQRLALALSLARGADPDQPRGLSKVTRTR